MGHCGSERVLGAELLNQGSHTLSLVVVSPKAMQVYSPIEMFSTPANIALHQTCGSLPNARRKILFCCFKCKLFHYMWEWVSFCMLLLWTAYSWWALVMNLGMVTLKEKHIVQATRQICCYYCSIAKLCPILCNALDCSTSGSSVLYYFPGVCSNSRPLIWWCYLTISSSAIPFSFCLQSFPTSGSFSMSQFFSSGGQPIGASASALPMNIQGWFLLGLTGLISLQSKGLSRVFSSITILKHQFFGIQPSYGPTLTTLHDYWKNHSFAIHTFVSKVMSLLWNTLSRFVISFLPRDKSFKFHFSIYQNIKEQVPIPWG